MILLRLLLLCLFSLNVLAVDIKNPFSIDEDAGIKTEDKVETEDKTVEKKTPGETKEPKLEPTIPRLTGPVVDQAAMLPPKEAAGLSQKIRSIHQKNGPQIQILILKSLEGFTIEQYSIKLAEEWRLGTKEKGDGIIILMSQADREVRIEVGQGIEGELTDLESHQIIQTKMIPQFKQGKFYHGFDSALNSIASEFNLDLQNGKGRDLTIPSDIAKVRKSKEQMKSILLPIIIFFITFPLLFKFLGKSALLKSVAGSAYLGLLTFFFVGQMFFIVLAVIFGFIIGMIGPLNFLMVMLSQSGRGRRGGGFGGGGWSGGGGGFSGGGASGRW